MDGPVFEERGRAEGRMPGVKVPRDWLRVKSNPKKMAFSAPALLWNTSFEGFGVRRCLFFV